MSKKKRKPNRARNPANARPKLGDAFIAQANTSYNNPAINTVGMIACNAAMCFLVGLATALVLGWLIDDKAKMTWLIVVCIAIGTAALQVALAVANSILVIPSVTSVSHRMMQRRTGVVFEDEIVEKAIDENEQPSRIGPAAIAATASFWVCLQYDAPSGALLWAPPLSAAASPVVAHLTDHKTIRTLWKGIKGQYYRATTRLSK